MACHAGRDHYVPLLTGMDYRFVESHALYRQLLSQTVHRAEALGARRIAFGMGAEVEKARFGAKPQRRSLFAQSHDQFHHDVLSLITSSANLHNED